MAKTTRDVIAQTVGDLPPPLRELVQSSIRFVVRPRPTPNDLALGAKPDDRGLFVGFPVLDADGDDAGEFVADEGDDFAERESAAVLRADEGDLVADVEPYKPGGTIALFTDNIRPLNETNLVDVILHELAHFAGEDEEGVFEMGLGDETGASE